MAHDHAALRGWLAAALAGLNARERYIVTERKLNGEARTLEILGDGTGPVEGTDPPAGGRGLCQDAQAAGNAVAARCSTFCA